jgi:raffinose/stachyose/melibiose transport system substrate-binding protein
METTADRPTYLQKLRTLIAANETPDIFDTDADAFAARLAKGGMLVDMKKFLKGIGKYNDFRPIALKYQEFSDGKMYTLPLEYHVEMHWYNKRLFQKYGLNPPKTMNEFLNVCEVLKQNGVTPLAVDGVDQWPLLRYLAMIPFRLTGNDYIEKLKQGKASFTDPVGMKAINFVYQLGKNGYIQEGFASTDYTTARDLFLNGKTAMYRMGSWELGSFTANNLNTDMKGNIDYFYLPMVDGATTKSNEYFVNSGIGAAFNAKKFDSQTIDFIKFLIKRYPTVYASLQQFPPMKFNLPKDVKASVLYLKIKNDMEHYGNKFGVPWDTRFDPDTNRVIGSELTLLASKASTPEEFAKKMDKVISENAPKYFK